MAGQLSRIGTTPSNMYPQLTLLWRNEKKKKKKKKDGKKTGLGQTIFYSFNKWMSISQHIMCQD